MIEEVSWDPKRRRAWAIHYYIMVQTIFDYIKEFTCTNMYTGSEIKKNLLYFIFVNNLKMTISSLSSAPLSAAPLRLVRRALLRHGSTAGQPAAAEAGGAGAPGAAPPRPFLVSRRGKLTGDIPA